MTEHDWQTSADALALLDYLYPIRGLDSVEPQSRASRLYLLACARRAWERLPLVCRVLVEQGEQVFFGLNSLRTRAELYPIAEELIHCRGEAARLNEIGRMLIENEFAKMPEVWQQGDIEPQTWDGYAHLAFFPFLKTTPHYRRVPEDLHSADLVREAFGNPIIATPPFSAAWRNENVLQLARHACRNGDFSTLPILADALEEAGCDCNDLLDHLRSGGPHSRGCWALQLVLD